MHEMWLEGMNKQTSGRVPGQIIIIDYVTACPF